MKKKSKRFRTLVEQQKKEKLDTVEMKIDSIKKMSNTKFVESIDLSFKINLKKIKSSESVLRTIIELPNGNGKKLKVAVLCDPNKISDAKKSGADVYGSEDLIKKISDSQIDFDKLVCTPSMMPKLGKLGKILGPKGLMPNPKSGTVTLDIGKAVGEIKSGQVELRVEKNGIIHVACGKISFSIEHLIENIKTIYNVILKSRPSSLKGNFLTKITISSSTGPGVKIDLSTIV